MSLAKIVSGALVRLTPQEYVKVPKHVVVAILATKFYAQEVGGDGEPTDEELRELWDVLKESDLTL